MEAPTYNYEDRNRLIRVEAMLRLLLVQENFMAKSLDDILADQQTALNKLTNLKTVEDGIAQVVTAQKQTLTDLQAQLAAAIASNDPAKVQQVADNMAAINAAIDVAATTEAAIANT